MVFSLIFMTNSLNLNEIVFPQNLTEISKIKKYVENETGLQFDRIHIGSNFCSQYFITLANYFIQHPEIFDTDVPITLTIPVVSQKNLKEVKELIPKLIDIIGLIDEVTVNDLGMLNFLKDKYNLNLGRLFFKDSRDFRINEYTQQTVTPNFSVMLPEKDSISGVEMDNVTKSLNLDSFPEDKFISIHYPYTFQSTGNICKFASIDKPRELKFRPNSQCGLECRKVHDFYKELFGNKENIEENLTQIFRYGRTVYFLNDDVEYGSRKPDRLIYFPLKELANRNYEDFNTI